jgi:hypothetical protein
VPRGNLGGLYDSSLRGRISPAGLIGNRNSVLAIHMVIHRFKSNLGGWEKTTEGVKVSVIREGILLRR